MQSIQPGDYVKVGANLAQVISIKGNDLEVALGGMKMVVKKSKAEKVDAPVVDEATPLPAESASSHIDIKDKLLSFRFELDLRGKMKDEVIVLLTTWADDAILLGISEARIMHGRGTGVIRDTVRSFLRKYKEIESLSDAPTYEGGDGVTLVKFKK